MRPEGSVLLRSRGGEINRGPPAPGRAVHRENSPRTSTAAERPLAGMAGLCWIWILTQQQQLLLQQQLLQQDGLRVLGVDGVVGGSGVDAAEDALIVDGRDGADQGEGQDNQADGLLKDGRGD